jgi:DNA mismatch endonuclease, patch repair protein
MFQDVSPKRRRNMASIRAKGTKPELALRRLAHSLGYRFRLHRRDLPGTPDMVFAGRRKIVLLNGCFWHCHTDQSCRNARLPVTRQGYWVPKLAANVARDELNLRLLGEAGWDVLVVWECEMQALDAVAARLREFLG